MKKLSLLSIAFTAALALSFNAFADTSSTQATTGTGSAQQSTSATTKDHSQKKKPVKKHNKKKKPAAAATSNGTEKGTAGGVCFTCTH